MTATKTSAEKLIIGRIGRAHGVHGWVKIHSFTDPIENIIDYMPWQLNIKNTWQVIEKFETKIMDNSIIAHFPGCDDRDSTRQYCNIDIAIERDQLPVLSKDEFYWTDLEGLKVLNQDGIDFGIVDHLIETGSNDVLVVKGKRQRLIPFIQDQVIKKIDLENKQIIVEWDAEF